MAQNRPLVSYPVGINTSVTNIFAPPALQSSTGVNAGAKTYYTTYALIKHIRVVNRSSSEVKLSMWLGESGASAAETEVVGSQLAIAANDYLDWYGAMMVDPAQFLTAQASASSALTVLLEGEIGIR